jgi:hypothetical protein
MVDEKKSCGRDCVSTARHLILFRELVLYVCLSQARQTILSAVGLGFLESCAHTYIFLGQKKICTIELDIFHYFLLHCVDNTLHFIYCHHDRPYRLPDASSARPPIVPAPTEGEEKWSETKSSPKNAESCQM